MQQLNESLTIYFQFIISMYVLICKHFYRTHNFFSKLLNWPIFFSVWSSTFECQSFINRLMYHMKSVIKKIITSTNYNYFIHIASHIKYPSLHTYLLYASLYCPTVSWVFSYKKYATIKILFCLSPHKHQWLTGKDNGYTSHSSLPVISLRTNLFGFHPVL